MEDQESASLLSNITRSTDAGVAMTCQEGAAGHGHGEGDPLTAGLDHPPMWIFSFDSDSGGPYVGVDDRTGEVRLLD